MAINNILYGKCKHVNRVQEDMTSKDDSRDLMCEIAHNKPGESYNPYKDVLLGGIFLSVLQRLIIYTLCGWGWALTIVKLDGNHSQYG